MDKFLSFVRGKRITLMGLGVLGRGVGDAEFLAKCGAVVLVTDKKGKKELRESIARLKKYPNISFQLGGHRKKDFTDTDMVLKGAGVPLDSPYIEAARKTGVPIYMSTALFAKYTPATIVGVTGTRGKSTVTQMIYEVLKKAGRRRVYVGGNVRGMSTLALLPKMKEGDIAALELDSWQLQGFGDLKISPRIAVFTNLQNDHLNYYPDMKSYFADKTQIFKHQKKEDVLITGAGIVSKIRALRPPVSPRASTPIPLSWRLKVLGGHNRENAALAALALRTFGISEGKIKKGIEAYKGIPGRLELLGRIGNVRLYNDGNATTPDATIAALNAFKHDHVVLIMGGTDKGITLENLTTVITDRYIPLVLIDSSVSGTQKLSKIFPQAPVKNSLRMALKLALGMVPPRGIVLFSPAFSSFGIFKNEYDRSDAFRVAFHMLRARP